MGRLCGGATGGVFLTQQPRVNGPGENKASLVWVGGDWPLSHRQWAAPTLLSKTLTRTVWTETQTACLLNGSCQSMTVLLCERVVGHYPVQQCTRLREPEWSHRQIRKCDGNVMSEQNDLWTGVGVAEMELHALCGSGREQNFHLLPSATNPHFLPNHVYPSAYF